MNLASMSGVAVTRAYIIEKIIFQEKYNPYSKIYNRLVTPAKDKPGAVGARMAGNLRALLIGRNADGTCKRRAGNAIIITGCVVI